MQSPWFDFWPKLLLSVVDKLVLGGLIVLVGYWFQKRLELFKRNQAFTSEWAKLQIAAYNQAFLALSTVDNAGGSLLFVVQESGSGTAAAVTPAQERYDAAQDALVKMLEAHHYLLVPEFTGAVGVLLQQLRAIVEQALRTPPSSKQDVAELIGSLDGLREAIRAQLPRFARLPSDDPHFSTPALDPAHADLLFPGYTEYLPADDAERLKMAQQALKKQAKDKAR